MTVLLSLSAAGRWGIPGGCPGSAVMEQKYPERESSLIAREGTCAHKLAEDVLYGKLTLDDLPNLIGHLYDSAICVDATMVEGVSMFVNFVRQKKKDADRAAADAGKSEIDYMASAHSELSVIAERIHPNATGTLDHAVLGRTEIHLTDLKYGFIPVEVIGNYQLLGYLAGLMAYFPNADITQKRVHLHIVQPRAPHRDGVIRTWSPGWHDIGNHFVHLMRNARIAVGDSPPLKSGPYCNLCSARLNCSTAIEAGLGLYEATGMVNPLDVSAEYLSALYGVLDRAKKQIQYLHDAADEEIKHRIRSGESIPGYTLESNLGHKRWNDPAQVLQLAEVTGNKNLVRPVTPAQAIREAGLDKEVVDELTNRPRAKPRIAVSDVSKAAQVFGK